MDSLCSATLNKFNSAKRQKEDFIRQTTKVVVHHNGLCKWYPYIVWSVSHCPMDSTWFPFDHQSCSLDYESWNHKTYEINLTTYFDDDKHKAIEVFDLQPNDLWEFLGKSSALCRRKKHHHFTARCTLVQSAVM